VLLLAATVSAYATDLAVNCGAKKNNSIQAALNSLSKQGPHTITVSGTCNEAVLIESFDNLTLVATPGASINDPTPLDLEDNDVIFITDSRVTVQGFTINGGVDGVVCSHFSVCYLRELIVQGASNTGVFFSTGSGAVENTTIQNTLFGGILVGNGSSVVFGGGILGTPGTATIQNNGTADNGALGVSVANGGTLTLLNATIQNHPYGDGAQANLGSFLRLLDSTITGSGRNGVTVQSSVVSLAGVSSITNNGARGVNLVNTSTLQTSGSNTITGNAGNGITVGHLSFVRLGGLKTISGNASPDVNCAVTTAKTQGTGGSATPNLGGGTTNCTEPAL
jgi:hypothetical protein